MLADLPLEQLRSYRGSSAEPEDFDVFWADSLAEARSAGGGPVVTRAESPLAAVETFDVVFPGWAGEPVRAWLRVPRGLTDPAPALVEFAGYGAGRGHILDNLAFAAAGFAHLIVDNRGSGGRATPGETGDSGDTGPAYPGLLTRGVRAPETCYYRRVLTDAVRAVDAMAAIEAADAGRIGVLGLSQGGGMALAAAALNPLVRAVHARAPFLADFRRAVDVATASPYQEIAGYLAVHRSEAAQVFRTLSYMDAVNFAKRVQVPGLIAAGLYDTVVPPSTVFAVYNQYAGPKELQVWEFNGHECGGFDDDLASIDFFHRQLN